MATAPVSTFSPDQFLTMSVDVAGETTYYPVPVGEYKAQVKKIDLRQFETEKSPGTKYTVAEIYWHVLGEEAKKATEQEEPIARQSLFLDLTPAGALDFGRNKNVQLSRLRDAVGQNKNGKKWAFNHLVGQSASVIIVHDVNKDTGEPRAVVKTVAKA